MAASHPKNDRVASKNGKYLLPKMAALPEKWEALRAETEADLTQRYQTQHLAAAYAMSVPHIA
eukprot:1621897-Rhodomonas_salina.3